MFRTTNFLIQTSFYYQQRVVSTVVRFSRQTISFNSALAVRRVNSFDENMAQKSQKSILAFFGKSVSTSSDNETPTKPLNKEKTKASSPVVHNSPLKEPNRNQDEDSLDSPIKTTKKRSSIAKRLDSSSDEEPENGSPEPPKQESPKKKAAP